LWKVPEQPQSLLALRRQLLAADNGPFSGGISGVGKKGAKHGKAELPPPLAQSSALAMDALQMHPAAHVANCVAHRFETHGQHAPNDASSGSYVRMLDPQPPSSRYGADGGGEPPCGGGIAVLSGMAKSPGWPELDCDASSEEPGDTGEAESETATDVVASSLSCPPLPFSAASPLLDPHPHSGASATSQDSHIPNNFAGI
jgi:hypothetical protein